MVPTVSTSSMLQPQPPQFIGKSVMLVDDESAYIDLLEQLLGEHLACPVHSYTRPADALRALPDLDVGLIVTDYNMPGLDGLEFLAEVQKCKPGVPAIMITAYQVNFTSEQLARVPVLKAIVRKPFKWTTLAGHIGLYWSGSIPPFPYTGSGQ